MVVQYIHTHRLSEPIVFFFADVLMSPLGEGPYAGAFVRGAQLDGKFCSFFSNSPRDEYPFRPYPISLPAMWVLPDTSLMLTH